MRPRAQRLFLLTAAVLLLATPLLLWSVGRGIQAMRNTPILWIPAEDLHRQQYEWFRSRFRVRDAVVISWPGCTVDDARLQQLADAIERPRGGRRTAARFEQSFDRITTGYGALREMTSEPLALSRQQALARLRGVLVGEEGRTSCAVVSLTEHGVEHPADSVELLHRVLRRLAIDPDEAYFAGPPVDAMAIDRLSAQTMQFYLLPSAVLVLLLARLCLRRWRLTLILIAVAAFGELFVLALVWLTGATMNAVLIVMAPLVFVLTVSAGVHLVNYYRDQVRHRGPVGAVGRALRAGWLPCSLAAVTTAIGLTSLVVSDMSPVRQFGALSATGVLTTTALLFLLIPEPLRRWGAGVTTDEGPTGHGVAERSAAPANGAGRRHRFGWAPLATWLDRRAAWVGAGSVLLLAVMAAGLAHVRTSVSVLGLLGPESRTARDYRWLESQIGPMIPIEIILKTEPDPSIDWLERIQLLRAVEHQIDSIDQLGGTMSAASFVPAIPGGGGLRATLRRSVVRENVESQLAQFEQARYLYRSDRVAALRITTRAPATTEVDYGDLMDRLQSRVTPVLDRYHGQRDVEVGALYTGITPLVHTAQQTLLNDLIDSFLAALVLVTVIVVVVLRSVPAGLVAMLPNLFPAAVLFGAMGWLRIPVDIGSMMTASVALGIAIDGTLHFLIWFRRETSQGVRPCEAVARTYRHCGTAMWQTTIICGLGLLVFGFSQFIPTRRFAWMMLLLLLLAVVGDLILLPALLLGPLRRLFLRPAPQIAPAPRTTDS